MEEYHDLDVTVAAFTTLLDRPEFLRLEAGIVLQAYLPDALTAMIELQRWAAARRARGGAAIKIRVVKGANLPMERVDASLHGWPLATWNTKQETDTNYKRLLHYAFTPERIENVRIGVAGHNLFDIAYAWELAGRRHVRNGIDVEMLLGMAQSQAEVIRRHVGSLLLYTPVVRPDEFDVAISYLVRRLDEGSGQENFMSAVFDLADDPALFEREEQRFRASVAALDEGVPSPNRTQNRQEPPIPAPEVFTNTPDTDPSLPQNREWGRRILERVPSSKLGIDTVRAHTLSSEEQLERMLVDATAAGRAWGARSGAERARILEQVADVLEARRADLLEVMAAEGGKTLDQSDPEVSEAIDFARYYAERARALDTIDGARFVPSTLTVVTPPWNFPVAIPAGSTLGALASGSAVVLKPATLTARCGSVLAEAMWDAGVPRDVLHLVHADERSLGTKLVSDPRVDRVVLTGAYETAELFRSLRPGMRLLAETSGKNAIVVTPSADPDLAVRDVVQSAFGHAGQKCSASSLVILVGSVARSRRFRDQLVDAVRSLPVGPAHDPRTRMGPLIEPARGKLLTALTELEDGESWLVEPRRLDEEGRLWTPGVRTGCDAGRARISSSSSVRCWGDDRRRSGRGDRDPERGGLRTHGGSALAGFGRDRPLARSDGGRESVRESRYHRCIVRRQPFGGWKKSSVGAGFKAGGPNYLFGFGSWEPCVRDEDALRRAFEDDERAWTSEFAVAQDVTGLSAERNLFRYRPVRTHVRLGEAGRPDELVRVLGAAARAGAPVEISSAFAVDLVRCSITARFDGRVRVESDAEWEERIVDVAPARVRLIGAAPPAEWNARCDIAVFDHPATGSGRIEMLPFLAEQSVTITAHRFGTPNRLTDEII